MAGKRSMTELLTHALAESDLLQTYADKASDELENLSAKDRTILLQLIAKQKFGESKTGKCFLWSRISPGPMEAEEAGALAILKHIAQRKTH
jgi:hypothetical protein